MKLAGFIVGPERSGTTLTSAFLSQHPEVYVINDPHYLNFFADLLSRASCVNSESHLGSQKLLSDNATLEYGKQLTQSLAQVRQWYERWEEFKGDPVDLEAFYQTHSFMVTERPLSITEYFHKFHLSLIPKKIRLTKPRYVVKIPDLARYSFILETLYPNVPVIYNVRHPVCNIASIIEPNRDRGWSFDKILSWYRLFFQKDIVEKRRSKLVFTRYEDLVLYDRHATVERILYALGLDSSGVELGDTFDYPNKKVMRKTQGRVDSSRLTSSIQELTPMQLLQALEHTVDIQNSFYPDLSLMKLISDVSALS